MADSLKRFVSQRDRNEWTSWSKDRWLDLRVWIQEHGELAFISGLAFGALLVLFPRIVVGVVLVAALGGLAIWVFAPTEKKAGSTSADLSDSVHRPVNGHTGSSDHDQTN